ncbi:hypothetical protein GCM10009837_09420 [Streptomyces durmitorensis]
MSRIPGPAIGFGTQTHIDDTPIGVVSLVHLATGARPTHRGPISADKDTRVAESGDRAYDGRQPRETASTPANLSVDGARSTGSHLGAGGGARKHSGTGLGFVDGFVIDVPVPRSGSAEIRPFWHETSDV